MAKPFKELRRLIDDADMMHAEVAERIGRSKVYFSARITGRADWSLSDIRALCALLNIPQERVGFYFLPDVPTGAVTVQTGGGTEGTGANTSRPLPDWLTRSADNRRVRT